MAFSGWLVGIAGYREIPWKSFEFHQPNRMPPLTIACQTAEEDIAESQLNWSRLDLYVFFVEEAVRFVWVEATHGTISPRKQKEDEKEKRKRSDKNDGEFRKSTNVLWSMVSLTMRCTAVCEIFRFGKKCFMFLWTEKLGRFVWSISVINNFFIWIYRKYLSNPFRWADQVRCVRCGAMAYCFLENYRFMDTFRIFDFRLADRHCHLHDSLWLNYSTVACYFGWIPMTNIPTIHTHSHARNKWTATQVVCIPSWCVFFVNGSLLDSVEKRFLNRSSVYESNDDRFQCACWEPLAIRDSCGYASVVRSMHPEMIVIVRPGILTVVAIHATQPADSVAYRHPGYSHSRNNNTCSFSTAFICLFDINIVVVMLKIWLPLPKNKITHGVTVWSAYRHWILNLFTKQIDFFSSSSFSLLTWLILNHWLILCSRIEK